MKIVIVGAGIGGLATYLHLKKILDPALPPGETLTVVLYEKHNASISEVVNNESPASRGKKGNDNDEAEVSRPQAGVGGALGLAPNGMHVLKDLDEGICHDIIGAGNMTKQFAMHTPSGWNLGRFSAEDNGTPRMPTVMIGRYDLWKILRTRVPDEDVVQGNVSGVFSELHQKPRLVFADGSPDVDADLVIGADGVKSAVRKTVVDDLDGKKFSATYEGLTSVFGFIPASTLGDKHQKDEMVMTLGADGFMGYCIHGRSSSATSGQSGAGDRACWWSTYPLKEDLTIDSRPDPDVLLKALQNRHSGWTDPVIQRIVAEAHIDQVYPTWTTPELPTWTLNDNVVLLGDAAHALQSSSGQGVSQALEDAQVLSTVLAHFIHQDGWRTDLALKKYVDIRKPRIDRIVARSKQMGDMKRRKGLIEKWITFFFIWLMTKWPTNSSMRWLYDQRPGDELKKDLKPQS